MIPSVCLIHMSVNFFMNFDMDFKVMNQWRRKSGNDDSEIWSLNFEVWSPKSEVWRYLSLSVGYQSPGRFSKHKWLHEFQCMIKTKRSYQVTGSSPSLSYVCRHNGFCEITLFWLTDPSEIWTQWSMSQSKGGE